ncbi:hypothetical protein B0H17DRAFT_1210267 [Mycena rosella]|uniref:Uncharacterized protein n=1 Tax=Mycena rosella TaxID=1033263 RepID=A0AAD7CX42_MYCRO|nr:hypothetical protein B0H17DRAFT_1210267 [Mycena rosella]
MTPIILHLVHIISYILFLVAPLPTSSVFSAAAAGTHTFPRRRAWRSVESSGRGVRAARVRVPAACNVVRGVHQGVRAARAGVVLAFYHPFFHHFRIYVPACSEGHQAPHARPRYLPRRALPRAPRPCPLRAMRWLAAASPWAITASP